MIKEQTLTDELWQEIEILLQTRVDEVREEIAYYPPPIPACDVYFNHLLELRATLPQAIRELTALRQQPPEHQIALLQSFVATTKCLDVLAKQAIQKKLQAS